MGACGAGATGGAVARAGSSGGALTLRPAADAFNDVSADLTYEADDDGGEGFAGTNWAFGSAVSERDCCAGSAGSFSYIA